MKNIFSLHYFVKYILILFMIIYINELIIHFFSTINKNYIAIIK